MRAFNKEKAVQMLIFFAIKNGGKIDFYKAEQLIYLSDRKHLRLYARTISEDDYVIIDDIYVAKNIHLMVYDLPYNIIKCNIITDTKNQNIQYDELTSVSSFNDYQFSETDKEVMNLVYDFYTKSTQDEFQDLCLSLTTRQYPDGDMIDLLAFFDTPEVTTLLFPETEEFVNIAKDVYLENSELF
jgi:hypothetical protein